MVRNVLAFGEFSQRFDGGTAFANGAIISLDPRLDLSIYHRHFDKNYNSPRSNAVSESSRNVNEDGLYIGFNAKLHKKLDAKGLLRFVYVSLDAISSQSPN